MNSEILAEQLAYYRARAQEYDETIPWTGRTASQGESGADLVKEWAQAVQVLHSLGRFEHALELACGTGLWTRELLNISQEITALDGSPEMLELNRRNLASDRIHYVEADLFTWEPGTEYDLVMFTFWLSHVPRDALGFFLRKVHKAIRPGGYVFSVDEPAGGKQVSGPVEAGQYQDRRLQGRTYRIIKVYYEPEEIAAQLQDLGFKEVKVSSGRNFFHLTGRREI